jgi:hypothetical protein
VVEVVEYDLDAEAWEGERGVDAECGVAADAVVGVRGVGRVVRVNE